jgi:CDGSH-type Zn-finger protein
MGPPAASSSTDVPGEPGHTVAKPRQGAIVTPRPHPARADGRGVTEAFGHPKRLTAVVSEIHDPTPPDTTATTPWEARDPRRTPWASVTACPDGPLLVRGDVEILLGSGQPADRRRRTVALCRCGASGIKPFCDGSHKAIGFRTDDEPA